MEPSRATNALGDLVVPTVDDEEYAFFGAQNTRAIAIEMAEMPEAEDDGVLRRNRPSTGRADPRLWFHPDSQKQTGCQRAMPQTPRDRWATRARPVEEVRKNYRPSLKRHCPELSGVGFWGGTRIAATEGQPNVTTGAQFSDAPWSRSTSASSGVTHRSKGSVGLALRSLSTVLESWNQMTHEDV